MTKSPLTTLLLLVSSSFALHAQQAPLSIEQFATGGVTGEELFNVPAVFPQPLGYYSKAVSETVIGETFFDLQTNASVQNRTLDYEDGTHGVAFLLGTTSPSFSDRGTGYNYYSNSAWNTNPTTRIESVRTGTPSLLITEGGTEAVISHAAGSMDLRINRRNPKGTGTWTETSIPNNTGKTLLWPRAVAGGANGNTIHCIAITAPLFNNGTLHQGVDGALLYYRSTDEGATWDIVDYLDPALDATKFLRTRADSYAIFSRGDDVAIAVFNQMADVIVLKSSDNGLTWTSQIVKDFPVDLYQVDSGIDLNNDMVADTIETSDESGALMIDHSGMVHLTFGRMMVRDHILNDNQWTFFPETKELFYWNETMGTNNLVTLAVPEDINGNGFTDNIGDIGRYKTSLCSQSSIGISDDGTLFVVYSGHREDHYTATQNYRHIYAMKSSDGGATWTQPLDLTPDELEVGYEAVFPNITPKVTDRIRLTYMRDLEPGLAVTGEDSYAVNQIMYLDVDTTFLQQASIDESILLAENVQLFPNPAFGKTVELKFQTAVNIEAHIRLFDIKGNVVNTIHQGSLASGSHSFSIETEKLVPGTYLIDMLTNNTHVSKELVVVN